jgi:hypothetical protein
VMSKGVGGRGYWGIWIFIINMNSYLSRISLAEGVFVAKIRCSWFLKKIKIFFNFEYYLHTRRLGGRGGAKQQSG